MGTVRLIKNEEQMCSRKKSQYWEQNLSFLLTLGLYLLSLAHVVVTRSRNSPPTPMCQGLPGIAFLGAPPPLGLVKPSKIMVLKI